MYYKDMPSFETYFWRRELQECSACGGKGVVDIMMTDMVYFDEPCEECEGEGVLFVTEVEKKP